MGINVDEILQMNFLQYFMIRITEEVPRSFAHGTFESFSGNSRLNP